VLPPDAAVMSTAAAPSSLGSTSTTETVAGAASAGDPEVLVAGQRIGRYIVRRLVGKGGMGRIYLARDSMLGRSVALKLVHVAYDAEDFIHEARVTAHLNHPHIVQIHDVGRHGTHAFLALEYVEGESLRDRLARERPSKNESLRILRAIADALAHAHAAGVFHCDLKPGNVMLPLDGRLRVVDFGLATLRAHAVAGAPQGTPDWMAPEQWLGVALCDRTDIWALAVIAHQLFTGEHPFGRARSVDERRTLVINSHAAPDVQLADQEVLQDLVLRSLSRDPQSRPPACDWMRALDAALDPVGVATGTDGPFRGLAPFDERHAALFFGRETDIDALAERLRESPTIAIVGPSGIGKSSFLHAGLATRLRARGDWTVISVRPGARPFVALAHRILTALGDPVTSAATEELAHALFATPSLIAVRLGTIAEACGGRVLLAIDQLEEVFTQDYPQRETERFLELLTVFDDAIDPVRVVYTVRDDFVGRLPAVRDLFVLHGLDSAALRRTIVEPVTRLGYAFDPPEIVDEMLADVGSRTVALPLIQFACRALWERRDVGRRLLLGGAYRDQGGVAGALARHADGVVAALTAEEQILTRQILCLLVGSTRSRRIVERERLLGGLGTQAEAVLDRLLAARLLVQHRPAGATTVSVELAHEALLVAWERLRRWLDESADERRLIAELDDVVAIWERRGARAEETWTEAEIAAARLRAKQLNISLPVAAERFLTAGETRHRAQRRRSFKRRVAALTATALVAAVALIAAARFREQERIAKRERTRALSALASLRRAGRNAGRVELELRPFDLRDGAPVPTAAAELPALSVRFYSPARGDLSLPGDELAGEFVTIRQSDPGRFVIEAPGGPTFVRIDGRGRPGEACAASWIRVMSLPGYAQRDEAVRLTLSVPTCAASAADTVVVPAGPFIYGGQGTPATRYDGYVQPKRVVDLAAFSIDQFELSNAAAAPFTELADITGYPVPLYPSPEVLITAADPQSPITSVDAFHAEALCRFFGKRLPTDEEWTKAARGGLQLRGEDNPSPQRLFPWGTSTKVCANAEGEDDGFAWVAPVDALPCTDSPYGVRNMVGNVEEWIARTRQTSTSALRVVRGGGVTSPPALQQTTTIFRNSREARSFDFEIGVRCVADADAAVGSIWRTH
jgi:eukaryotic-like serine/threonine-protein kinase